MREDVTEHDGIEYSIQPRGIRSRLLLAFAAFVVAFGGALAVVISPAYAAPGDMTCFTEAPSTASPTPGPVESASCPVPSTVTTTVTTTVTVTETKTETAPAPAPVTSTVTQMATVYVTKTQTETETETVTASPSSPPSQTPQPSITPSRSPRPSTPLLSPTSSSDGGDFPWKGAGLTVAGVGGLTLLALGVGGVVRRRRENSEYQGRHAADDTQVIPGFEDDDDDYSVDDYREDLGGHAGDTWTGDDDGEDTQEQPRI